VEQRPAAVRIDGLAARVAPYFARAKLPGAGLRQRLGRGQQSPHPGEQQDLKSIPAHKVSVAEFFFG
jgi:hypothetical protein